MAGRQKHNSCSPVRFLVLVLVTTCSVERVFGNSDLYNEIQDLKAEMETPSVNYINNEMDSEGGNANLDSLPKGDLPDMLGLSDGELQSINKRTLSVGGGLRSLAEMVYSQERARRHEYMSDLFKQKGKRSWRFPVLGLKFLKINYKPKKNQNSVTRRRSNQLSVSGPLSALANMLAAEGRERKQSQSMANRLKLIELGKRNDKTFTQYESEPIGNTQSDLGLDLYR